MALQSRQFGEQEQFACTRVSGITIEVSETDTKRGP
jgi:hypothetical protein